MSCQCHARRQICRPEVGVCVCTCHMIINSSVDDESDIKRTYIRNIFPCDEAEAFKMRAPCFNFRYENVFKIK